MLSKSNLLGDINVNIECTCGNTSRPNNLCDGSHWMCKWVEELNMIIKFKVFVLFAVYYLH